MKPAGEPFFRGFLAALQFFLSYRPFKLRPFSNNSPTSFSLGESRSRFSNARADNDDKKRDGKNDSLEEFWEIFWEEVHEAGANFTLLLILIHIGGLSSPA